MTTATIIDGTRFQLWIWLVKYLVQMIRKPNELMILKAPQVIETATFHEIVSVGWVIIDLVR